MVEPELLDHLPVNDPAALRSRRDLRRINFLMGNERWILKTLRGFPEAATRGIVELGAGDGFLTNRLAREFPAAKVSACDLAPPPPHLDGRIKWRQGDILSAPSSMSGGVLIANLFLHHFEGDALRAIGRLCAGFEVMIFNEPDRVWLPRLLGGVLSPFINRVTRHDMHVSIRAGFKRGELPAALGLSGDVRIKETSTWRGGRRVIAWRA